MSVKFQSDQTILNTNLTASRLHEILQYDVSWDIDTEARSLTAIFEGGGGASCLVTPSPPWSLGWPAPERGGLRLILIVGLVQKSRTLGTYSCIWIGVPQWVYDIQLHGEGIQWVTGSELWLVSLLLISHPKCCHTWRTRSTCSQAGTGDQAWSSLTFRYTCSWTSCGMILVQAMVECNVNSEGVPLNGIVQNNDVWWYQNRHMTHCENICSHPMKQQLKVN